jgi:hypothetical protein
MNSALTPIPVAPVPRLALRTAEAAEALGVSERWLWERTRAGVIPHVTIGGVTMYPVDRLREWLTEQSATDQETSLPTKETSIV